MFFFQILNELMKSFEKNYWNLVDAESWASSFLDVPERDSTCECAMAILTQTLGHFWENGKGLLKFTSNLFFIFYIFSQRNVE